MLEMLLGGKKQQNIGTKMTYAQFQAWLTANSTKYTKVTDSRTQMRNYAGMYVNVPINNADAMYGTSFKEWFTYDSWLTTIARHAHPSLPVFTDNFAHQPQVLLKLSALGTRQQYFATDRNGYLSKAWTSYTGAQCLDFIYYDYTLGSMVRYNPSIGNDVVAFNGTLL